MSLLVVFQTIGTIYKDETNFSYLISKLVLLRFLYIFIKVMQTSSATIVKCPNPPHYEGIMLFLVIYINTFYNLTVQIKN